MSEYKLTSNSHTLAHKLTKEPGVDAVYVVVTDTHVDTREPIPLSHKCMVRISDQKNTRLIHWYIRLLSEVTISCVQWVYHTSPSGIHLMSLNDQGSPTPD